MLIARTHHCGDFRSAHVGQDVVIQGWVQHSRDRGGVSFLVVRDRSGTVQVTLDERCTDAVREAAKTVALEYVVQVCGRVQARYKPNTEMSTGEVEIVPTAFEVLSGTRPLPFSINNATEAGEDVRLHYRFLDLRRAELQRNLIVRHRAVLAVRHYLDREGFLEIETPILTKSTPEGARDYLVPSRVHPGQFYALPQSPQLFKQILMIAGYDRYMQIARCFRDEDLRADRQPEFTQIDLEMSFVTRPMVMAIAEGVARAMWKEARGVEIGPIGQITWHESMARFGVDAPDLRFGMEHIDLSDTVRASTFAPITQALSAGGIVKGFVVPGAAADSSRKVFDGWTEFVRKYGLGGLLWGKLQDGVLTGPAAKVLDDPAPLIAALGANDGDVVLIGAGKPEAVHPGLGRLRVAIARERGMIPADVFAFTWVVDFPMFERTPEGAWTPMHHPFTSPRPDHLDWLGTERMGEILSDAYDLVCNGSEIGGGSIRIHREEIQQRVFEAIGIAPADASERFGFLLDALAHGAPPHGGLAFGLDRCIAILCGADSIRDVIAFPKTTSAQCLMSDAPSAVPQADLDALHIKPV